MDQIKKRGPGRPPLEKAHNMTKCFRLSEETAKQLDELMVYYGKKENKTRLSVGKTIEHLIKEKHFQILCDKYEDD